MILVGDIGNTETKICLVDSRKKIIKRITINTKKLNYSLLKRTFKFLKNKRINKSIFCSVVPHIFIRIKNFLRNELDLRCFELKQLPIKSLLKIKVDFNQIGSDRISNSISVMNDKDNFIILDFGTATTFDVVIKDSYIGGVIAPGLNLSLNTLIDKACLIPKIDLKKMNKVIGLNTVSAVRSGFFWGYQGLIDNIVNLITKETKRSYKIIGTGGFSHLFKKLANKKVIINKDITIKGLIKASNLIK
tara:strand:+ start:836 stop:1576 length:741 start_codon:yes stop_codon:yes gene_type:complete